MGVNPGVKIGEYFRPLDHSAARHLASQNLQLLNSRLPTYNCSVLNKLTQLKRLCQVQLVIHYGLKL